MRLVLVGRADVSPGVRPFFTLLHTLLVPKERVNAKQRPACGQVGYVAEPGMRYTRDWKPNLLRNGDHGFPYSPCFPLVQHGVGNQDTVAVLGQRAAAMDSDQEAPATCLRFKPHRPAAMSIGGGNSIRQKRPGPTLGSGNYGEGSGDPIETFGGNAGFCFALIVFLVVVACISGKVDLLRFEERPVAYWL
jgi:hypothetical protein